jgi:hypothetical protein
MEEHMRSISLRAFPTVIALAFTCAATAIPRTAVAQGTVVGRATVIREPDDRAGPRFGVAYLTRGSETAAQENKSFSNLTTLFGWQFEHAFPVDSGFPVLMTEFVVLVGGLEQNVPLPSATWLIALRQPNGLEFGVGPTVTGTGTQIAFAMGVTQRYGVINVPVNVAIAPARKGAALSVTAGFNLER